MDRPNSPSLIRRWIGLPLIALYASVLVLAAWREEVRPAFLDPATRLAEAALGEFGIPPGLAVFDDPRTSVNDLKQSANCFWVRGYHGTRAGETVYPPRPCPAAVPKLFFPREDVFLYRLALALDIEEGMHRVRGSSTRYQKRIRQLTARILAHHFDQRIARQGAVYDQLALLTTVDRFGYWTGWLVSEDRLLLRWEPGSEAVPKVLFLPSMKDVFEQWGPQRVR